ncbi:hypothetical protein DPMN_139722 [Dreissena polymorpha]|uniref:Uncharacterized protein n=1 Tax=Dreissena polymorpha TaxID=45954 RepID=A0A9D4JL17_DREPO|nr:hypothetical protein DPMN_139722 [Dreissena polymorpha]
MRPTRTSTSITASYVAGNSDMDSRLCYNIPDIGEQVKSRQHFGHPRCLSVDSTDPFLCYILVVKLPRPALRKFQPEEL